MNLLISILLAMGFHYTPAQIPPGQTPLNPADPIAYATFIRDNGLFHITAEEGVVIDVDVNPRN
ncbi:MAG: hypothetical protein ABI763_02940 [Bacteroidota bacterium]